MSTGVRLRVILLGAVLAAAHTVWVVYEETVWGHLGTSITAASLVSSALAVLMVMLAWNALVRNLGPGWRLRPGELMVVFTMVTVAAVMAGFDLIQNLPPILLLPFRFANEANRWDRMFPHIQPWLAPRGDAVVKGFFTGGTSFFEADIYRPWLVPIAAWSGLLLVISFTMLCMNTIMRRRWVEEERLPFPLLQVPMLMVREEDIGSLFRNRTLAIGFAIPAVIESLNVLHGVYPSVPGVHLNVFNLVRLMPTPPWNALNPLFMSWPPIGIGLAFLMPLDLLFSCWVFYLMRKLFEMEWVVYGWGAGGGAFPYIRELTYGAFAAAFVILLRGSHRHIGRVIRRALGLSREPDDSGEVMSYRMAVLGLVASAPLLVAFAIVAGMTPSVAVCYFCVYLLATVVMTRIYAQVGTASLEFYFLNPEAAVVTFAGSKSLSLADKTLFAQFFWFNRCYRQHPMGHQIEAMRFAGMTRVGLRPMAVVLGLATVIGVLVGLVTTLHIYYTHGASTAKVMGWQMGVAHETYGRASAWMDSPQAAQTPAMAAAGISFTLALGLSALRNAFMGFPLHPLGYVLAVSYAMEYIWAIFVAVWAVKALIIRYGGLRAYWRAVPFFVGLVLGDACTVIF
ncbi:MAG: hypothetical protein FJX72_12725, partial [Armatimonadetes bacterium]|nr:hypothetical protein [Armatimonadota bacterium]